MSKRFSFVLIALTAALTSTAIIGCTTQCTQVGCDTGLHFNVPGATAAFSGELPVTLRLCADTRCRYFTISQDGQGAASCSGDYCDISAAGDFSAFVDADVADKATATVQVKNAGGDTLFEDSAEVPIAAFEVNGEGCGPTCHAGEATFTPTSK